MELHRRICVSLVVFPLWTAPGIGADPDPPSAEKPTNRPESVLPAMLVKDSVLSGVFTADFEIHIERYFLGPDQGKETRICHYTASDAAAALSVETQWEGDPPYHAVDTPGYRQLDFDADGNLIVWRSLRKVSLSSPDFSRTYDVQEVLLIAPTGEVLSKARGPTVYEYPAGSRAHLYEFDQFRMAAGRGFTGEIEKLKAQRTLAGGVEELVYDAPSGRADWHLYVDIENSNLVRQANKFTSTFDRPSLHMENSGVIRKDGLALARDGSLSYAVGEQKDPMQDYILKITVLDFSTQADEKHLDGIRALVTPPFPPGTKIVDHKALFPQRP